VIARGAGGWAEPPAFLLRISSGVSGYPTFQSVAESSFAHARKFPTGKGGDNRA